MEGQTNSLGGYLRRDYENERECEYVDGTLIERTGGDTPHGLLHSAASTALFMSTRREDFDVIMSYSMWISPTRIRVPDIVVTADKLRGDYRRTPPLLGVEILAPEGYLHTLFPRLLDIQSMGCVHLWLLDPRHRIAYTYTTEGLRLVETTRLTIPNTPIYLDLPELFASLD